MTESLRTDLPQNDLQDVSHGKDVGRGCGERRGGSLADPVLPPLDSSRRPTRKTIRRDMLERLVANERGDINLDDEQYNFILDTLRPNWDDGDDSNASPKLSILTEQGKNSVLQPPNSLTRGCPNSNSPKNAPKNAQSAETHKGFHFGGYDGGFTVGLEGEYHEGCLERLCNILDIAKTNAGENPDGKFDMELAGRKITVYASGVTRWTPV